MNNRWTLVDTPLKLKKAKESLCAAAVIALDTEYDSFRYFRDKLCLLQIQTGDMTWIIDPLAGLDLSFLGEVLSAPEVLKIFHAGDNDIRILRRDYEFTFHNIFDTHRAAALLGGTRLSLSALLKHYLSVTLVKEMQRSRWDLRPLRAEQLDYAALDTAHLIALHRSLDAELRDKGLAAQAQQIFTGMAEVKWQPKTLDPTAHRRIAGYDALTPEQQDRLRRLLRWRFEKAQETNCALFMLLTDRQLLDLSRLENTAATALSAEVLISPEKANRFEEELLSILKEH